MSHSQSTLKNMHEIVERTWRKDLPRDLRLSNAVLGLIGECGEVVEHIKKHLFHGHSLDIQAILVEIGDVYFYLGALEIELGVLREQAELRVQEKLLKRYPDGFSSEKSTNRSV